MVLMSSKHRRRRRRDALFLAAAAIAASGSLNCSLFVSAENEVNFDEKLGNNDEKQRQLEGRPEKYDTDENNTDDTESELFFDISEWSNKQKQRLYENALEMRNIISRAPLLLSNEKSQNLKNDELSKSDDNDFERQQPPPAEEESNHRRLQEAEDEEEERALNGNRQPRARARHRGNSKGKGDGKGKGKGKGKGDGKRSMMTDPKGKKDGKKQHRMMRGKGKGGKGKGAKGAGPTMGPSDPGQTAEPTVEPGSPTRSPTASPTFAPVEPGEPTRAPVEPAPETPSPTPPTDGDGFTRCFDSPNLACPEDPNIAAICDKYNPISSFERCYALCIDAFCCIHDSIAERSPSCSDEPNCIFYKPCYIIWWKLHDTIGPAPYLRIDQDERFYDVNGDEFGQEIINEEAFFNQFFGHHFLTDDLPLTDDVFTDPDNW